MTAPRIVTHENTDPIVPAHLRWQAWDDRTWEFDGPDPVGRGATEAEAIDDLMEQMEDGNDE